jgi:hypothetical protein
LARYERPASTFLALIKVACILNALEFCNEFHRCRLKIPTLERRCRRAEEEAGAESISKQAPKFIHSDQNEGRLDRQNLSFHKFELLIYNCFAHIFNFLYVVIKGKAALKVYSKLFEEEVDDTNGNTRES